MFSEICYKLCSKFISLTYALLKTIVVQHMSYIAEIVIQSRNNVICLIAHRPVNRRNTRTVKQKPQELHNKDLKNMERILLKKIEL